MEPPRRDSSHNLSVPEYEHATGLRSRALFSWVIAVIMLAATVLLFLFLLHPAR